MIRWTRAWRAKCCSSMVAGAFLLQLGGCQFGDITTSVTLSARELLINVFRGVILTPIDTAITAAINNAFADDDL